MNVVAAGGLTQWASDAVSSGGGWVLAAIMLGENLFPPIPSEAVLPLAGFLVSQGELTFVLALLAATAGSVAGALALYALGRWGGRPVLLRWHHVLRLTDSQLDRADDWFDARGPQIVFWCRMLPVARSIVSIPAGASQMPLGKFVVLTTAGTVIWNTLLIVAGLLLGNNWERVRDVVSTYSTAITVALGLLAVGFGVRWLLQRRDATPDASR